MKAVKKTRSDYGRKGFIKHNALLIQNVAFEIGKTEKQKVYVNPLSEKHGDLMRDRLVPEKKVSDELYKAAKDKLKLLGTQSDAKRNYSPLRKFWGVLFTFDQMYGTQLQRAMQVWMVNNPAVKELRTRKRLVVMVEVACKMAKATGVVFTTAPLSVFESEGVI